MRGGGAEGFGDAAFGSVGVVAIRWDHDWLHGAVGSDGAMPGNTRTAVRPMGFMGVWVLGEGRRGDARPSRAAGCLRRRRRWVGKGDSLGALSCEWIGEWVRAKSSWARDSGDFTQRLIMGFVDCDVLSMDEKLAFSRTRYVNIATWRSRYREYGKLALNFTSAF